MSLDGKYLAWASGRGWNSASSGGYASFKDKALANPPTLPPPSPVAKAAPAVEQAETLAKGEYLSQLRQQAEAWRAVAAALDMHFPKWNGWDGHCPRDCAIGTIADCDQELKWAGTQVANLRAQNDSLTAQLSALRAERDALKKAKDENDERFMIERDTVRAERDAMRPVVEAAERWQDYFAPMTVTVPASANLELEVLRYRSLHLPAKSEKGGAA